MPTPTLRIPIPPGDEGTAHTIEAMKALARHAAASPRVRQAAARIARKNGRPQPAEVIARAVYWFLSNERFRFQKDPKGVELVRTPASLLDAIAARGVALGDCDDRAVLGAALLAAAGVPAAFVLMAERPGGRLTHVYFAALIDGRPFPLDPQEGTQPGHFTPHARQIIEPL